MSPRHDITREVLMAYSHLTAPKAAALLHTTPDTIRRRAKRFKVKMKPFDRTAHSKKALQRRMEEDLDFAVEFRLSVCLPDEVGEWIRSLSFAEVVSEGAIVADICIKAYEERDQ